MRGRHEGRQSQADAERRTEAWERGQTERDGKGERGGQIGHTVEVQHEEAILQSKQGNRRT